MRNSESNHFSQQRQKLIISSAKRCFSRSGFHGTSMADLSRESGLGAGQIYRYFTSKELIVTEAIRDIAESWRAFLLQYLPKLNSTQDIINEKSPFWLGWSIQDRRLLLEVYSEASRNEDVRAVLAQQEKLLIKALEPVFAQRWPHSSVQQRTNRIHFLLLLIDGVACRTYSETDLDQTELRRINNVLSEHIFS